MQLIFTIGQLLFGGFFIYSGVGHFRHLGGTTGYAASKGVPVPKVSVVVSGLVLILGGLGIILDIMTGYSLALVAIFLVAAAFMMHNFWKEADPMARQMQTIQFTKNLALAGAAMMLLGFTWF